MDVSAPLRVSASPRVRAPLRVLVATGYYKPAYAFGGPTRALAELCEALAATAQVTVISTDSNGPTRLQVPLASEVSVDGVRVRYYPLQLGGLGFFLASGMYAALAQATKAADVVLINAMWGYPFIAAARVARAEHVPYVVQLNGQLMPWAMQHRRLKKAAYFTAIAKPLIQGAAAVHCTEEGELAAFRHLDLGVPAFVVPNMVDVSRYATRSGRYDVRERFGIPANALILVFLGRLTAIKRPDIAVAVLGALSDLDRPVHLLVAGPDQDGLAGKLQDQAREMGCAARLHLTGLLGEAEVSDLLQQADLLLMPTEVAENFGMSAAEAMAAGAPVLVSPGVPVGRWAERAGAGRVAECTPAGFAQQARALLCDQDGLRQMKLRARALAVEQFDRTVVARQMEAELRAVAQGGRPLEQP